MLVVSVEAHDMQPLVLSGGFREACTWQETLG